MADITVSKERIARLSIDEYAIVNVHWITTFRDDDGDVLQKEKTIRITPDDDIDSLPNRLQTIVQAARYPEALARWEQRKTVESSSVIFVP